MSDSQDFVATTERDQTTFEDAVDSSRDFVATTEPYAPTSADEHVHDDFIATTAGVNDSPQSSKSSELGDEA